MSAPHSCTFVQCCSIYRPMAMVPAKVRINNTIAVFFYIPKLYYMYLTRFLPFKIAGLFFSIQICCGCIFSQNSSRRQLRAQAGSFYFPTATAATAKTARTSSSVGLHPSSAHGLHRSSRCSRRNQHHSPSPL